MLHSVQVQLSKKHRTRWEEDYQLIDSEGLFQEYLEMGESSQILECLGKFL
jgi:hypothetical protein